MIERAERKLVVEEALTWVRTPFKWEACVKGVGVDCGRFLAIVFNNAGVKQIDIASFPKMDPQWFLHKETGGYINQVRQYTTEYELKPYCQPKPGDIILARIGRDWAHGAIVVAWPRVVGAAVGFCVTEWKDIRQSPQYMNRKLAFFNPWGVRRD